MARMRLPTNTGSIKVLIDWAESHGWSVEKTGRHLKYTHPRVKKFVIGALTPGDARGWMNDRARMRRYMLEVGFKPEEVR